MLDYPNQNNASSIYVNLKMKQTVNSLKNTLTKHWLITFWYCFTMIFRLTLAST